jgi:TonB-dependent SusC/RagA subfamily outer membrane receptor
MNTTHTVRVLATTFLVVGAACRPLSPRQPEAEPNPRATSTSNSVLTTANDKHVYSSMEELFEAKASGVQVVRMNGSFALRIRGLTSAGGNLDPLIVVDGHPSDLPGTRALEGINPNDVVRIEVLKDAASTSFYGVRGGAGVVLVRTRKQ